MISVFFHATQVFARNFHSQWQIDTRRRHLAYS